MSNRIFPLSILGCYIDARLPYRKVNIDESVAGVEVRSTWWLAERVRYTVKVEVARSDARRDYQQLMTEVARNFQGLDSFLIQDLEDNTATSMGFGRGDGVATSFQLQRSLLGTVLDITGGPSSPWAVSSTPRTNLVTQSQTFDNAAWTKTSLSVTATAAVAPDNTRTGEKLVEAAASSVHSIASAVFAETTGLQYTLSVYLKAVERTTAVLQDSLSGAVATFDLSAGTTFGAAGCTSAIASCGNGWYRCSITITAGSSANSTLVIFVRQQTSYVGDGASGIFAWGAQAEQSTSYTQYIVTVAAAVTVWPNYWPQYFDGFQPVYDLAAGTRVFVNGVEKVMGTDFTLTSLGAVNFTVAPASNASLTWTGGYYIRCRWDDEKGIEWKRIAKNMWGTEFHLVSVKPSL